MREGEGGEGFYIVQSGRRADLRVSPGVEEGEGGRAYKLGAFAAVQSTVRLSQDQKPC
jgi:hypothetical protein